jgi:hypothetical protein
MPCPCIVRLRYMRCIASTTSEIVEDGGISTKTTALSRLRGRPE